MGVRRWALGAVAASAFSLLAVDLPRAVADSYSTPQWSTRSGVARGAKATATKGALKWKRQTADGVEYAIDEAQSVPSKAEQQPVARAVHEVEEGASQGSIQLMSLSEPADDPANDPFQDEVTPDDELADSDESTEADELTDEEQAGEALDPEEIAQRPSTQRDDELPDSLRLDLGPDDSELPMMGDEFAAAPTEPEKCPSPRDLKPINQIDHRIASEPGLFPQECALSETAFQPRNFAPITFTWKASALCHKPLYFQQPKLERYGHTFGLLTPIISVGHFFVMVPCLPYNMGLEPPWECVYPLGWYRPGSCAPYTLGPLPLSLRGAASQAVATTGLWYIFQ